ncbi:sensor histidine kinase [Dyadobacter pollutisoli]|uniref:histidine kinase n=1 Tax=Dyadobacter pollutisoli TaxID=2910158 RepID=A0A9E8NFD1_9BACT|nr:HAMP domain-containing sensor histidine kinase [Dyadobacter pollutisoli]WAC13104.1 ATP-binding protein [Dyadobacter pollutisoli]
MCLYSRAILTFLILLSLSGQFSRCPGQVLVHDQVVHYGGGNGLEQSTVRYAATDAWGYLWLATQSGVVRFDGRRFQSFNSSDIPGLSNDRIEGMGVAPDGQLWFRTVSSQFMTVVQPDKRMAPVPRVTNRQDMIIPVAGFVIKDRPLIAQFYKELEKSKKKAVILTASAPNGEVYLHYLGKLFYVNDRQRVLIDSLPYSWEGKERLSAFTVTHDGIYMTLFSGNHVRAWRHGKQLPEITRLEGDILTDGVVLPQEGFSLLWSRSESFLYAGRNIYRVFSKNGLIYTERVISNIDIAKGLSAIQYLEKENKYVLCLKLENGGISIIQPAAFRYPALPKGIRSPSMYAQARTGPDAVYTRNFLFTQNGSNSALPTGSDMNDDCRTSYFSPAGELYFENGMRLMKYNTRSKTGDSLLAVDELMKAIVPDKYSNDLLFCTRHSINRLAGDRVTRSWKIPGNTTATTFLQIDRNRFLVGTENGLKWFDAEKNKIERTVLDSASIWTLLRENNDLLWIGTYGKGFYLLNGNKLTAFPLGPGKALKTVHSFIDDGRGHFWMPSNDGLFRVSKKDLLTYAGGKSDDVYYFRFDKRDGLTNNEFNGGSTPSHVWLADSMLSIPAVDGLVWFYPHRVTPAFPQHPILLEQLLLNGHSVPTDSLARLPAGSHTLDLRVGTAYLGNPENLRLEYQVHGYSHHWEPVPNDGKVVLQNFPAGDYNLIFRKRKTDDPNQYDRLEIPFRIAPYFYNTWWFYTLVAIALVGMAYLFARWRTRTLELEARRLELKVEERTRVLNNMILQLEHSENQLRESDQIKDRMVSMILHDLRSPIRFLEMMGTRLIHKHRELDEETLTERIVEIGNSASSIYSYVNQFLTWTSTQHGLYTVRRRWIALAPLFESIRELYTEIARYQQNTLTLRHNDIHCDTDPDLLMAILRNLVDNAMKYTHEGRITLTAKMDGNEVKIIAADTGSGMKKSQIAMFYGKSDEDTHAGLGSTLVRDLLQKLEGHLSIESKPGKGTSITIYLTGNHLPDHNDEQGS